MLYDRIANLDMDELWNKVLEIARKKKGKPTTKEIKELIDIELKKSKMQSDILEVQKFTSEYNGKKLQVIYNRQNNSVSVEGEISHSAQLGYLMNFLDNIGFQMTLFDGVLKDLKTKCEHPNPKEVGNISYVHGGLWGQGLQILECDLCKEVFTNMEWIS